MIDISSQILYHPETKKTSQPFWKQAGLHARKCSSLLQRRTVDFSSHRSFRESIAALEEHYGFAISYSAVKEVTHDIGQKAQSYHAGIVPAGQSSPQLIVELDGSMVPIEEYSQPSPEQQKEGLKRNRNCHWKEFRLGTVSIPGEVSTSYGVTRGTPLEAGCMIYQTAQQKGLNEEPFIHGVADGAPWIAQQYEEQFGENHRFILDFYHTSEYLAKASRELAEGIDSAAWFKAKQRQMKEGKSGEVIAELHQLSRDWPAEKSALSTAADYLGNRKDQLKYDKAIEEDLPIGSGEVESGHKSVLQARLKKPGAWWKLGNAESMAHLKVMQANQNWEKFWGTLAA